MANAPLIEALPGFDRPLDLLRACHVKILAHCDLLEKLQLHVSESGVDSEAARAAVRISRYFTISAEIHHRDEEEDLFPRLERQSLKITELMNDLKMEHEALEGLWNKLAPELQALPADGFSEEFDKTAAIFCDLYRAHIERENTEFLPLVSNRLSQMQIAEIGTSMAIRRGANRPDR